MYSVIVCFAPFKAAKTHVSSEILTINTLCGRHLGFDYGVASEDGRESSESKTFTKEQVLSIKSLCSKCRAKLIKL